MDRDEADRLLGADRAEPLPHPRGRQPEAAGPAEGRGDEVAVAGLALVAGADQDLALAGLLVDRDEPPAALRQRPEDAERLGPLLGDDLDDPAGILVQVGVAHRLDPDQGAVADARNRHAGPRLARRGDEDLRDGPVLLVPFRRLGHELAVAVAPLDVGEDDGRQLPGLVDGLAAAVDDALGLEVLQHLLEPDPVAALDAEGLGDLALADLAGGVADEGGQVLAGGQAGGGGFGAFGQGNLPV